MQLVSQLKTLYRLHGKILSAVLGTLCRWPAQDHFRVFNEVAVDTKSVRVFSGLYPHRFLNGWRVPLLQENNIGNHLGSGISPESVIRQADSPQQVSPRRQILPHSGILGIQGVAAGYKGYHSTWTYPVQRFCKKVVVDVEAQLIVLSVTNRILPEGHIAHSKIKEIPGETGFLIAPHSDVGLGIELLGDAACDAVQLHAIELGCRHALRQQAEEVSHTAGGLQYISAFEAHFINGLIYGFDNDRAGIVGIECRCPRRHIFLRGERRL